jgi:hypothetical protein
MGPGTGSRGAPADGVAGTGPPIPGSSGDPARRVPSAWREPAGPLAVAPIVAATKSIASGCSSVPRLRSATRSATTWITAGIAAAVAGASLPDPRSWASRSISAPPTSRIISGSRAAVTLACSSAARHWSRVCLETMDANASPSMAATAGAARRWIAARRAFGSSEHRGPGGTGRSSGT